MYVKVEPSGCVGRHGLVQIRFCMYLDEGDYGYDVHHIQVPERPLTEEELADPALADLVPKVWQNNPFHNHFIYVKPETTDKVIMDIGEAFLNEAYIKWTSVDEFTLRYIPLEVMSIKNPRIEFPASFNKAEIDTKVRHLKTITLERSI